MKPELCAISLENFRGFRRARLDLSSDRIVLVGPNNAGKTSVLRILDWLLNEASTEVLLGEWPLDEQAVALLKPARETRNAARRITLEIAQLDGRRHERFQCVNGVANLRFGLTVPNGVPHMRVNVGAPRRGEEADRENALVLLQELRESISYQFIPASRDASSATFQRTMRDALMARLEERALHSRQAGARAEYRSVKSALDDLNNVARSLATPLWDVMQTALPPGLAQDGRLEPEIDPRALVSWIADNITLRLTTGTHDSQTVVPTEVGSGLQSLLQLAVHQTAAAGSDVTSIVAIEEPEAFLHPSAQRTLARSLLADGDGKRIISTHSAAFVDEAPYGSVVLVRSHQFYHPQSATGETRTAINSALMSGHGSEMAFADSVLLVEGESDRLFFEQLRQRVAAKADDGRLDRLYVVPAGSKSAFSPWLQLFRSYGTESDRPIQWLVVADADAPTELRRAWRDASVTMRSEMEAALAGLAQAGSSVGQLEHRAAAVRVNETAEANETNLRVMEHDLEWCALKGASAETLALVGNSVSREFSSVREALNYLGSKAFEPRREPTKSPWIRGLLAQSIPWAEVAPEVRHVLIAWFSGVMSRAEAEAVIDRMS